MLIYIIALLIILVVGIIFNCNKTEKHKKIFLIFAFSLLIAISMFRAGTVGVDTPQYVRNFTNISHLEFSDFSNVRYEVGFSALCKILSMISSNPQILIIVTSIFINFAVAKFIKNNSKDVVFSTVVYILLNFFFNNMNIMRQAIAMAIIMLGYELLKNNKWVKFIIVVLIASLFHQSALLAVILVLLRKFKFNKKFMIIVSMISVIFFFFGDEIFVLLGKVSPRLLAYLNEGNYIDSNFFAGLIHSTMYLLIFAMGMIIINKYSNNTFKDKDDNMNTLVGIIGCAFLSSILAMKVSILSRFTPYFSIFLIIWLPNCLALIKKAKTRLLIYLTIFAFLAAYWVIIMVFRPEWYGAVPYISMFN